MTLVVAQSPEMSDPDPDEWLTTAQAVAYTKFSERTLKRARIAGELQSGGTASGIRYRRRWLDEWLERDERVEDDNDR